MNTVDNVIVPENPIDRHVLAIAIQTEIGKATLKMAKLVVAADPPFDSTVDMAGWMKVVFAIESASKPPMKFFSGHVRLIRTKLNPVRIGAWLQFKVENWEWFDDDKIEQVLLTHIGKKG